MRIFNFSGFLLVVGGVVVVVVFYSALFYSEYQSSDHFNIIQQWWRLDIST